ncbi:MAG: adenosylmethionine--8-amino-7-oxononanoate transaminase [Gilvibacter sp.]
MSLSQRDKKHLWHPLTQHKNAGDLLPIAKAQGAVLWDDAGNQYIDAISSWYVSVYGHCNPLITSRIAEQMLQMDQIVFSGFTHRPAVELSEKLMAILPDNQQKIFFSDNGSTSVEVAIKMALQYYFNQDQRRDTLIAFEEGFHGDTFGAMSVSGLSVYNGPFEDFSLNVLRIPTPDGRNNQAIFSQVKEICEQHKVAGFVYEPLVQGAAAMKMYDANGLNALLELFKEIDVLTIADEVMTGFGKTGRYFASDWIPAKPDIICLSKALTAGMIPMGLTSCSQKIFDAFYDDSLTKGFFHGHTYSANPLACAAAIAGIELLTSNQIQDKIAWIIESHKAFNAKIKEHTLVKSTRQSGVIYAIDLAIEMDRYGGKRDKIFKFFMDRGVFLRPLGNTIYILPPYVISQLELDKVYQTIEACLLLLSGDDFLSQ